MAGKQNSKKNGKSRKHNQKRIAGPGGPIPSLYRTTLKYRQFITLAAAASTTASWAFRLNGLFDPDFTGTGSQPMYFDQFALLYTKYRVLGASWIVTACNEGAGATIMTVTPTMANVIDPNMTANTLQLRAKNTILAQATGAGCNKTLRGSVTMAQLWGATNTAVMDEDDFAALVTGNPNNVGYLWLSAKALGTVASNLMVSVEISYDVAWHMVKQSAMS